MKIVFFGSPASALPSFNKIHEAGHSIDLVITQPDKPQGRGKIVTSPPMKKAAEALNIPIYQPPKIRQDPIALERIKKINPELIVVVAYGQIIPASIIYLPKYNSINLHFSLLPKYRGASPVFWALLKGERKTGISIFELNEKMDEGDILAQEEIDILPEEKTSELESRLAEKGAELLVQTISKIETIKPLKQDHSQATYAPKIKKEDGKIDWKNNARFIASQVRAFNPWPSAFTFLKENRIKILEGKEEERQAQCSIPGKILSINKEGIEVCCGSGSVYLIRKLQPENKKSMDAYSYTLGAKIKMDDRFM